MIYTIGGKDIEVSSIRDLTVQQRNQYMTEQREIELDSNSRIGVRHGSPECKIYSEEFIKRFLKIFGYELHYDYAGVQRMKFDDICITSVYGTCGIMDIERWFVRNIIDMKLGFDDLKKRVLTNPHLHPIIRNELYRNLVRNHTG